MHDGVFDKLRQSRKKRILQVRDMADQTALLNDLQIFQTDRRRDWMTRRSVTVAE